MEKNCKTCGSTVAPIYCWDCRQVRSCGATSRKFGDHSSTHMDSPLCDQCAANPAFIQCFTDGLSFCSNCFMGQHCVTNKHHMCVIPFSYHSHCSAAPILQLSLAAGNLPSGSSIRDRNVPTRSATHGVQAASGSYHLTQSDLSEILGKSPRFTHLQTSQFLIPSSAGGTLQNRPQQPFPFSIASSSGGTLQNRLQQADPPGFAEPQPNPDIGLDAGDDPPTEQIDPDRASAAMLLFPLNPSKKRKKE